MRITSITVAFNADPLLLARQLVALQDQVDKIIIVDNGSVPSIKSGLSQPEIAATLAGAPHIEFIELNENGGIAAGFNVGIAAARKRGAELVLLMDHDSVPAADMVSKLYAGYLQAIAAGAASNVAAIGPRIVDTRDAQEFPFIRLGWFRNLHIRCGGNQENLVACDLLISRARLSRLTRSTESASLMRHCLSTMLIWNGVAGHAPAAFYCTAFATHNFLVLQPRRPLPLAVETGERPRMTRSR